MFRRLTLVLVLAGLGLAVWGAQTSAACSPPPGERPPLRERLAAASGAFVGTVISRRDTPPGPDGGFGSGDPTELRFVVERAYKGDLGSEVDVMTVRSVATCGLAAQPGDRLGLLLRTDAQGRWTAFLGDAVNPGELEDAARALADPAPPPLADPAPPPHAAPVWLSLRAVRARDLRVRVTASRAGTATLVARVAGLRIRRTLRFAAPGTRTARLIPVARGDRRRLTAARRRTGPLHATVTATMADARASTRVILP